MNCPYFVYLNVNITALLKIHAIVGVSFQRQAPVSYRKCSCLWFQRVLSSIMGVIISFVYLWGSWATSWRSYHMYVYNNGIQLLNKCCNNNKSVLLTFFRIKNSGSEIVWSKNNFVSVNIANILSLILKYTQC